MFEILFTFCFDPLYLRIERKEDFATIAVAVEETDVANLQICFSLSIKHTVSFTRSLSLSHPHPPTHTHTHSLSLFLALYCTQTNKKELPFKCTRTLSLVYSLAHTHSLSLTHTLSLAHSHTHTLTHSHTHTHTFASAQNIQIRQNGQSGLYGITPLRIAERFRERAYP